MKNLLSEHRKLNIHFLIIMKMNVYLWLRLKTDISGVNALSWSLFHLLVMQRWKSLEFLPRNRSQEVMEIPILSFPSQCCVQWTFYIFMNSEFEQHALVQVCSFLMVFDREHCFICLYSVYTILQTVLYIKNGSVLGH